MAEHQRWCDLAQQQALGLIRGLELHKSYELKVAGELICKFIPDFVYVTREGAVVVEDYKSEMTRKLPEYRIKVKLFEALYRQKVLETLGRPRHRRPIRT